VNLGDGDNRVVRCSDLFNVLVPGIDDALIGDKSCRVANGLVFSMCNSLSDAAGSPSRRQLFHKKISDCGHEGTGVGLRANSPGKFVDTDSSLFVLFVLVVSTLLDGGLRLSGTALLGSLEDQREG
jgi:hypothetical protein